MVAAKSSLVSGEFVTRAHAALPSLGATDKRFIELILSDPEAVVRGSVTELAQRAGVAQSSAVRACQRIGYRGYQDVKLAITRDLAQRDEQEQELAHEEGIGGQTPVGDILDRILRRSARALVDAAQTVDPELLALTIDRIAAAGRVLVIGNGTSAAPAHDAAYRLSALGLVTMFPTDVMAQHLAARHLDESCVCLVVSHTGASRESLRAAEAARAAGAFVAAITSFTNSPLTRVVDAALVAGGPEYGFRLEAMASRLAHLGIVDALFVGIAVRRPKASTKALDVMADTTIEHSL
ncbi:MurR/RpiR family transcriptional regulator [Streptomyces rugosispiralis]|uniref:MurR/RpiR family transcriptional regulator n=1 Tax=Streptomyces rugosispiralis TaxID=2967341 RepID=A0ABT1UNZ9_9ACTN|nr:MurR/RpiR family transcriptional regulator [Streptomyces rugosispiralis]MCQ8186851.1 MurR/RpiR family transcriptional regulator [Streptomyces rugosispiralis]